LVSLLLELVLPDLHVFVLRILPSAKELVCVLNRVWIGIRAFAQYARSHGFEP